MKTLLVGIVSLFVLTILVALGLPEQPATAQTPSPQLERGAMLYAENCAVCHGERGEGRVGVFLRKDFPSINPSAFLRQTISNGVRGSVMPAWSKANGGPLDENQIDDVVAYIQSWTGGQFIPLPTVAPVPTGQLRPTAIPGDPARGAILYAQNCRMCHGQQGEGQTGARLAKDFPSIDPNAFLRQTISNGVRGSVMPAWSTRNGGPLGDQEIDDIIALIRTWGAPPAQPPQPSPPPAQGTDRGGDILFWIGGGLLVILLVGLALAFGQRPEEK